MILISVKVPRELYETVKQLSHDLGYPSVSEAIRDALVKWVASQAEVLKILKEVRRRG